MQNDQGLAALGAVTGIGGVSAAAACCVLPLALASAGVGASGLAALSPLHTPLTFFALVAVAGGWLLYIRRRRSCATGFGCRPAARSTLPLLIIATLFVALGAMWPIIEAPIMAALQ